MYYKCSLHYNIRGDFREVVKQHGTFELSVREKGIRAVKRRPYLSENTRQTYLSPVYSHSSRAHTRCRRGCAIQRIWIQLRGDSGGEHVCPITGIPRVRLDEEGLEQGPTCVQAFVIPDEETACIGCCQHVEGTSDMRLVAEGCTMVGRRREPVVSRQRRGVSCSEVAEVVVSDADCSD